MALYVFTNRAVKKPVSDWKVIRKTLLSDRAKWAQLSTFVLGCHHWIRCLDIQTTLEKLVMSVYYVSSTIQIETFTFSDFLVFNQGSRLRKPIRSRLKRRSCKFEYILCNRTVQIWSLIEISVREWLKKSFENVTRYFILNLVFWGITFNSEKWYIF